MPRSSPVQTPKEIIYKRPWMYPKQEDAFFNDARYAVVEASTKAGKTVACMAWLLEQAFLYGKKNRHYWWVAPIYAQAEIAYRRIKAGLPQDSYSSNDTKLSITLHANGSVIDFKGADKPDSLYGEDVYAAVIDEFTRVKAEGWHAVRSTLTQTQGPIRLIGNVKGRANWGYAFARLAETEMHDNNPAYHYAKLTAYDAAEAGIFPFEEVEDAKKNLPEHVFRELFLAEPADDGGNPFGLNFIELCTGPLSTRKAVAYGLDLAKSYDYTVLTGLDAAGDVCRFERWQAPWQDTIRRVCSIVDAPTLVDSTGVGDPVLESLQAEKPNVFTGIKYTSQVKQQLMEGLAVAIQQRQIRYPQGPIVNELMLFEYQYTPTGVRYSAPEGAHDDCVNSLALAVHHWGPSRRDLLPFGWLRSNLEFRRSVLGEEA